MDIFRLLPQASFFVPPKKAKLSFFASVMFFVWFFITFVKDFYKNETIKITFYHDCFAITLTAQLKTHFLVPFFSIANENTRRRNEKYNSENEIFRYFFRISVETLQKLYFEVRFCNSNIDLKFNVFLQTSC